MSQFERTFCAIVLGALSVVCTAQAVRGQEQQRPPRSDEARTGDAAVSYTHLDVYKRQTFVIDETLGHATKWDDVIAVVEVCLDQPEPSFKA